VTSSPFAPDVVAAVAAHMNGDHAEDCVVICRVLGGRDDTTAATMTGVDGDGVEFLATTTEGNVTVRVPFSEPITERAQIRAEVARMYHESAAALGLPSREH
jgi:putative heme iron utilization protein